MSYNLSVYSFCCVGLVERGSIVRVNICFIEIPDDPTGELARFQIVIMLQSGSLQRICWMALYPSFYGMLSAFLS